MCDLKRQSATRSGDAALGYIHLAVTRAGSLYSGASLGVCAIAPTSDHATVVEMGNLQRQIREQEDSIAELQGKLVEKEAAAGDTPEPIAATIAEEVAAAVAEQTALADAALTEEKERGAAALTEEKERGEALLAEQQRLAGSTAERQRLAAALAEQHRLGGLMAKVFALQEQQFALQLQMLQVPADRAASSSAAYHGCVADLRVAEDA